ncbi:MAG TPA: DUF3102 domain-containing protein [Blastocatellia bacterium]|nr:DUF3102 domain-containing protein [Blastocatellia bacterium]
MAEDTGMIRQEAAPLDGVIVGQGELFDYSRLDQETQIVLRLRAGEIKSLAKRVANDIVEIGGKLAEVKDRIGGNGKFVEWLHSELRWSERTVYNLIAVWQRFHGENLALENVAASALYLLAAPSTPAEAVEAAKQLANSGEQVTHGVAKEIVRQAKTRRAGQQPKLVEVPEPSEELEIEDVSEAEVAAESEIEEVSGTEAAADVRACRECGCTEDDCSQCVAKTGSPCHWVEDDLCSACVSEPTPVAKPVEVSEVTEDTAICICGHRADQHELPSDCQICVCNSYEEAVRPDQIVKLALRSADQPTPALEQAPIPRPQPTTDQLKAEVEQDQAFGKVAIQISLTLMPAGGNQPRLVVGMVSADNHRTLSFNFREDRESVIGQTLAKYMDQFRVELAERKQGPPTKALPAKDAAAPAKSSAKKPAAKPAAKSAKKANKSKK